MAIISNMYLLKYILIVLTLIHLPKKIVSQRLDSVDSLPLTADGWRPILSNRPQQEYKHYQDVYADTSNIQAYTPSVEKYNHYSNSSSKVVTKPSEISSPAPQTNNTQNQQTHGQKQQHKTRLNAHSSNIIPSVNLGKIFGNNQDIVLHGNHPNSRNHGNILNHPYKMHGTMTPFLHTFGSGSSFRHPVIGKLQAHMASAGKRYKHPGHLGSATTRDEVFLSPPTGILGSYPFFHSPSSKGISSVHHGSTGGKHYIFPGALPTHIEFPNHYSPLPNVNEELYQQLMRDSNPQLQSQFTTFSKHNFQNEFTRNILPPPFKPIFETENAKTIIENLNQKHENVGQPSQTINDPQIVVGKQKHGEKTKKPLEHDRNIVPENLVVQLPPPHHSGHSQDNKNIELEITKEKFNVYHDHIPPNYSAHHPQVQNFFTSDAQVTQSKSKYSPHTYEVTEGKYEETTQQPNYPQKAVSNRYFNQIPSSLQDHEGYTFLPTPYRPLKVNPTLSTHDVSTLFNSYNQNKVKPHDLFSPTQYPIYKEQKQYQYHQQYNDISTQLSVPSKDSQRINYAQNEVTTLSEYEVPPLPTIHPSSYYYTINQDVGTPSSSVTERVTKRPKLTTTSTTTTTEAPVKTTRSYTRNRTQTRRRRPTTSKPTISYKDVTTTTPSYESRVTTPTYDSYQSISDITNKNYQQPSHRPKLPKPYRTTQAPESEVLTTSLQPAIEPTLPIQNKYQIPNEQNDEESEKYSSQKHRVRPVDFMDEFEDTEYLQSKYQEFEDNRYNKHHKQHPIKDESEYDDYVQPVASKYNKKPNRERSTRPPYVETDEYPNRETTKSDFNKSQKGYYQTYDVEENTPKYTPKTTHAPLRDDESVTESYDITKITENELDPTILKESTVNSDRIKEVFTTKSPLNFYSTNYEKELVTYPEPEATTVVKTVTTTEAPTTKANKLRNKTNRYETNRPRFSVKDYRYKVNQQSTSTENSNPETTTSRIRFPTRTRTPQTSTESSIQNDESRNRSTQKDAYSEDTRKFVPKESRYKSTTESIKTPEIASTTERTFSSYRSNRTRPNTSKYMYGRYRSTTENGNSATVTVPPPKVVIKPNTLLKRPAPLSLRTRIMNKQKAQNISTTTTENTNSIEFESIKTDSTEYKMPQQTTLPSPDSENKKHMSDDEKFDIEDLFSNQSEKSNTEKETETDYSQRIADLTSSLSSSKDYNSQGMFKTVSPNTSRRVPNYFTIATDDPILPIEAFFPQLSQKDNQGN